MSIVEQITEIITQTLTVDLAEFIADKFGLDSAEVSNSIHDYLGCNSTPVVHSDINKIVRKFPHTKQSITGVKSCQFEITRGKKSGQLCGTAIRGKGDYCSKHKHRKAVQELKKNT